jgi:hypothetical protein
LDGRWIDDACVQVVEIALEEMKCGLNTET